VSEAWKVFFCWPGLCGRHNILYVSEPKEGWIRHSSGRVRYVVWDKVVSWRGFRERPRTFQNPCIGRFTVCSVFHSVTIWWCRLSGVLQAEFSSWLHPTGRNEVHFGKMEKFDLDLKGSLEDVVALLGPLWTEELGNNLDFEDRLRV